MKASAIDKGVDAGLHTALTVMPGAGSPAPCPSVCPWTAMLPAGEAVGMAAL